jgi:hypothetical protein
VGRRDICIVVLRGGEASMNMEFLQSWRIVRERDAQEFVHILAWIMAWGKGRFNDVVVDRLNKVPKRGPFE